MPFVKGQSGNPGGRPKECAEVKALAQQHGKEAIAKLVELMRGSDVRVAKAAADSILDRAYGKPTQTVEATVEVDATPAELSDAALAAIAASGQPG